MSAKGTLTFIASVFKKPTYGLLAFCIAMLMVAISTYALNLPLIKSTLAAPWAINAKAALLAKLLGGVLTNNTVPALALLLLTSVLAGLNIAAAAYLWKNARSFSLKQQGASTAGVSTGILAAGCASCGISVLAMLGLGAGLAILPFKGLELSLLSVGLLTATLFWMANAKTRKLCALPKRTARNR